MTTALSNSGTTRRQDQPKTDVFTCLKSYYAALSSGDEFLIESWQRHLEFLRDMQFLGDPTVGKRDAQGERG